MNELEGKFDDIETIPMFDMEPTPAPMDKTKTDAAEGETR